MNLLLAFLSVVLVISSREVTLPSINSVRGTLFRGTLFEGRKNRRGTSDTSLLTSRVTCREFDVPSLGSQGLLSPPPKSHRHTVTLSNWRLEIKSLGFDLGVNF